jgi:RHS repeat-associated protein
LGSSLEVTIAINQYDELGRPSLKKLGQARTSLVNWAYTSSPMDTLRYAYNIRGWVSGINKDYANAVNGASNWFGMELDYDCGFVQTELNGNIAGVKWRNNGDGIQRAFGYAYDGVNRLLKGDFTQNSSSGWNTSAGIDFGVRSLAYDANGNILTLTQKGLKLNTSQVIDSLTYGYNSGSNQLNYVTDHANDTSAHLGDFTEITNNTSQDYTYDGNGNLTMDNNKQISTIHYDYLNLPDSVAFTGKGYVKFIYAADGTKLGKIVIDNTVNKKTVTTYLGSFIYQYTAIPSTGTGADTLQFVLQPEGRIRPQNIGRSDTVFFDFFEQDQLGNTRVVLTDKKEQDIYPAATLENNTQAFQTEKAYYTVNTADTMGVSRIPSWSSTTGNNYPNNNGNPPVNNDPYANTSATSAVVYHLNGATGDKSGLGITLKVMAGDQISIYAKSFWHNNTGSNPVNNYLLSGVVNSFIAAFAGMPIVSQVHGATATVLEGSTLTSSGVTSWLQNGVPNPSQASVPRAYVNWILFNNQFVPIASNCGFDLVSVSPDAVKSHTPVVNIGTSGYLYVYCSNESNIDVYFDNLQVVHNRGPLVETNDYYPFGLTMAGISDKALESGYAENKYRYNKGSELQNKEFSDGSGLQMYSTSLRTLDPQLGRWWQVDPKPNESESPYVAMMDNPVLHNDPFGDTVTQEFLDNGALVDQLNIGIGTDKKTTPFYMDKKGNLQIDKTKEAALSKDKQEIVEVVRKLIENPITFVVEKQSQDAQLEGATTSFKDEVGNVFPNPTFEQAHYTGETVEAGKDGKKFRLRVIEPESPFYWAGVKDVNGKQMEPSPMWLTIYHEMGHGYFDTTVHDPQQGGKTLEFENKLRSLKGLVLRATDEKHPAVKPVK